MGVKVKERPKGSGEFWVFINYHGKRKAKKIGRDKRLAKDVAEKIKAKIVLGDLDIERMNRKVPTFQKYAEMWLALPHDRKQSTQENYTSYLRNIVYPNIGSLRIDEVRRKDIKLMFDTLLTQGRSSSSFSNIKAPVKMVLDHALDSELIESNPANDIKFKRKATFKVEPLTEDEAFTLLDRAKEHREGLFYPPILCLLRTGLRAGELQALTWADLDFENRLINVNKSWRHGRLTGTKNNRTRKVDMTPHVAETLRALRKEQWRKYAAMGKPVPPWVFVGIRGETLCQETLRHELNAILKKAELKRIRVHDLRHTYATTRLLRGHNIGDVSYQLGHSDVSITYRVYGHWIPGKFKAEVDDLDMQPNAIQAQPEKNQAAKK